MALPSLAPTPMLDERQRAALTNCVTSILEELVASVASATLVSSAMGAVLSATNSACAGFAAQWNDLNGSITKGLPVEMLTVCLALVDFETRVRACQVSRAWRSALISDRYLWTDIYCPITHHQERAFRLLEELLQRSSPLPIRLRFPHTHHTKNSEFRSRISTLVAPHIHRLQSYNGPLNVFVDLDPSGKPLPALTSLDCRDTSDNDGYIVQRPEWSALRLPNLRRLVAPVLRMSETQRYERLQHLVCGLCADGDYRDLFGCFPNLITAEFVAQEEPMLLPRGPLPSSIECITIHAARVPGRWSDDTNEDFDCLEDWAGERIPRLVLHGANSVSTISHAFVSARGTASRLDVGSELRIASAPGAQHSVWEVHTCDYWWDRRGCEGEMLTMLAVTAAPSICVTNYLICPFFKARARLPHLVSLTFNLADITGQTLPPEADGTHYVEAPNLQHVRLETCGYTWTLGVLQDNFREMLIYEAELIESLTVDYLGYKVTKDSDCAELARFAKQYIEVR